MEEEVVWSGSLGTGLIGAWYTSADVIVGTPGALTAYAVATGSIAWTWKPPKGEVVCGLSNSAADGLGTFDYGTASSKCTQLQEIDLATGVTQWSAPLDLTEPSADGPSDPQNGEPIDLDAQYALAPYGFGGVSIAATSSGKEVWSSDYMTGSAVSVCGSAAGIADTALVGRYVEIAVHLCDVDQADALTLVSKPIGAASASKIIVPSSSDCADLGLLDEDGAHLLVACNSGFERNPPIYSLTPGSDRLTRLDFPSDSIVENANTPIIGGPLYSAMDGGGNDGTQEGFGDLGAVASAKSLYTVDMTDSFMTGSFEDQDLTAISLDSGAQEWTRQIPDSEGGATDFGAGDDGVYALASTKDGAVTLFHVGAASGTFTELAEYRGAAAAALGDSTDSETMDSAAVEGDRLVVISANGPGYTCTFLPLARPAGF